LRSCEIPAGESAVERLNIRGTIEHADEQAGFVVGGGVQHLFAMWGMTVRARTDDYRNR
jgi:hypothetical protein